MPWWGNSAIRPTPRQSSRPRPATGRAYKTRQATGTEPTFPPAPDWRTTEALDAAALFALSEGHSTS